MNREVIDIRCSFTVREGIANEIGKDVMEVNDEMDKEMGDEAGFLQETPATPTCLTMSLPSSSERSSAGQSTSLSSDPLQTTVERCSVLSGLPKKEFNTACAPASGHYK